MRFVSQRPRAQRTHLAAALAATCLLLAGCATSVDTASPLTSDTVAPSRQPTASDNPAFDLSGTSWRATSVAGHLVPAGHTPRLEFDWLGRPNGTGFTGCDEFGFEATFDGGRVAVGELIINPSGAVTAGIPGPDGTVLLSGPLGEVVLGR